VVEMLNGAIEGGEEERPMGGLRPMF
jgi:hypothetical protein